MTSSQNKALHFPSPFRTLALKSLPVKTWDTDASLTQYDDAIENHTRFKTIMFKMYPCFRKQVKHRSMWGDVSLPPPPPCAFRRQHKRCNDKVYYLWALSNTNVKVYSWRQGISQEVWRQCNRNLQSEACAWHWQFCFEKLVGHIVIELSFLIDCFLQTRPNNVIIVETTGPKG